MTADDVCAFLALMEKHRVDVWRTAAGQSMPLSVARHGVIVT